MIHKNNEYELENKWGIEYCPRCIQMTNWDDDGCLKCRSKLKEVK